MRCPQCQAALAEGAQSCDACGAWLGPLDGIYTSATSNADCVEPPAAGPPPRREQAAVATRVVSLDAEEDRLTRIVEVEVPARVRRAARPRDEQNDERPLLEQLGEALSVFYRRMHRIDRWSLWALALAALGAFLPWYYARGQGWISGVEDKGLYSALAAAVALTSLFWRQLRRRLAGRLITVQLLAIAALLAVPVHWMVASGQSLELSLGLPLTLLGGALAVVLSLARLARLSS